MTFSFHPEAESEFEAAQDFYDDREFGLGKDFPTAAWDMQAFWYNVTKAGEVKYGPEVVGDLVQIQRNGNGAA